MKITKQRFILFEKIRKSGKLNMWAFDAKLCNEERYTKCYKHFITNNKEEELTFKENE